MEGITCDRCGKSLLIDESVRYEVKIVVQAAYDPMELTAEDQPLLKELFKKFSWRTDRNSRPEWTLLTEGEWKVLDVAIEGVSLVITYRSSFSQQIQRNGIDGLIRRLAEKSGAGSG